MTNGFYFNRHMSTNFQESWHRPVGFNFILFCKGCEPVALSVLYTFGFIFFPINL